MNPTENEQHDRFLRSFTANEGAIRAYVRRLVPTRADADDVMQEVSVVLWKKFGQFRAGADFRAWAFGVARYAVLAWRRDKARDRLVLDENVVLKLADETAEHEDHLESQREALEKCIQRIHPGQRELLMEAYESHTQIQEVATRSGRTVTGFYQWLHRVRRMLLDCVRRALTQNPVSG